MYKNIELKIWFVIICGFALGACEKNDARTIIDRMGSKVTLPEKIERIITTAPSNTEIVIALGLQNKLIAIDKYSADVEGIPAGLPLIDFFSPDGEAVIGMNPDIIIANGHNQTGSGSDPLRMVEETGVAVVYIPMSFSIDAIYEDIEFIASILNVKDKGAELVTNFKNEIEKIGAIGKTITNKKNIYFEISPTPSLVTIGHGTYIDEMIFLIGAVNIFHGEKGIMFPSGESIIGANPDVIITNILPADISVLEIKKREGFENIKAVKQNNVFYVDSNSSSRPSQNILLALKQMARFVYPEYYANSL